MECINFLKEVYKATRGAKMANSLVHAFRKSSINQAETAWRAFKAWLPEQVTVLRKRHVIRAPLALSKNWRLSFRPNLRLSTNDPWVLQCRLNCEVDLIKKTSITINFSNQWHACLCYSYLGLWYTLSTGLTRSVFPSVFLSPSQKIKHRLILVRLPDKPLDKTKIPPCTVSFCSPEGKPSVFTERE